MRPVPRPACRLGDFWLSEPSIALRLLRSGADDFFLKSWRDRCGILDGDCSAGVVGVTGRAGVAFFHLSGGISPSDREAASGSFLGDAGAFLGDARGGDAWGRGILDSVSLPLLSRGRDLALELGVDSSIFMLESRCLA